MINEDDKLLVFTTGQRTMAPHQIGVKLMSKIKFKRKLNIPQVTQQQKIIRCKLHTLQDIRAFIREQEEARQRARDGLVGRLEVEITPWHNYKVQCVQ